MRTDRLAGVVKCVVLLSVVVMSLMISNCASKTGRPDRINSAACAVDGTVSGVFRSKITIDHTKVFNTSQKDFCVLISFTDPVLKSKEDIFFTGADGKTKLGHELVVFDSVEGRLKAWVRIPFLSCSSDTELYLYYSDSRLTLKNSSVWDSHYKLLKHLNDTKAADIEIAHSNKLNITDEITVHAWVYSDDYRA